jgi:hypothetical protein
MTMSESRGRGVRERGTMGAKARYGVGHVILDDEIGPREGYVEGIPLL